MSIPHILRAPKVQIGPRLPADLQTNEGDDEDDDNYAQDSHEGDVDDSKGWYEDGAYIGAPDLDPEDAPALEEDAASEVAIHDAYFTSLLAQYHRMRSLLAREPSVDALTRLPPSLVLEAGPLGRGSTTIPLWSKLLRATDPHPVQIHILTKDSILSILRVMLGGKLLQNGYNIEERTSRWLWALLARLPERGELDYAEIGCLRDLGKRAVLLGRSLVEMAALRDELDEGQLGVHENLDNNSDEEEEGDVQQRPPQTKGRTAPDLENAAQEYPTPQKPPRGERPESEHEDGEVSEEDEDVAMDIGSNSSDEEEGQIDETMDDVKARLLAQLDADAEQEDQPSPEEAAKLRLRMNMRLTLNMILTVVGEFYGQRDLLEFREPFVGM